MKILFHLYSWILFFGLFSSLGYSQIFLPDSLLQKDTYSKSVYFNESAKNNQDLDSMLLFTDEAIKYANECSCDSLKLASNFYKAYFLYHSGKYKKAIDQLKLVDSINTPVFSDHYHYKMLETFGVVYIYTDDQSQALVYGNKAMEFAEKLKDSTILFNAYYSLGYLYDANEMVSEAKKYYLISLDILNKIQATDNNIFRVYLGLRETADNYDEFKKYNDLALSILKKDDAVNMAFLLVTGSTLLIENKSKQKEAREFALKGLKISDSINYIPLKKIALYNLGYLENELGSYKNAIPYFEEALKTVETNSLSYSLIIEGLSKSYDGINNYKKAYEYKDELLKLKDSVYESKSSKEFAESDAKFKAAQKDKEIAQQQLEIEQQKNKRTNWIIGSLIILLIGFSIFQWRFNKQKEKKFATENELKKEQEINNLRSKFLGNIAHEIRTPLTLISGNINLALENLSNTNKMKENLSIALENSKKVTQDANEILDLLKFEKNKTIIKKTSINLDETLQRIVFSFKSFAEMKKIKINYQSLINKNYTTELDIEKLEKIINNLISNAIKYSPTEKEILINANCENEKLTFSITDYGQGIHYDETEKIFERFYQSEKNKSIGGIGIGLSLSKEFAELLDGSLSVTSKIDEGSTFTLSLPAPISKEIVVSKKKGIEPKSKISTIEEEVNQNIHQPSDQKILIVEDNPQMANYLKEILTNVYDCTLAFDGKEAIEKLKVESFDLITSDIMMPKMDGFELRASINKNPNWKNIPFILISAKSLEEDKIKGFTLGIDDYIVKPFNKNELIARINNLLTNKKSRDTWKKENENILSHSESSDEILLKKIEKTVLDNIDNDNLKVIDLAKEVGYSQRQLSRLLNQYVGMSPAKYILEIRLQKAYRFLQKKSFFTLAEVRYNVGILTSSYFNKKFKERFGVSPSELL